MDFTWSFLSSASWLSATQIKIDRLNDQLATRKGEGPAATGSFPLVRLRVFLSTVILADCGRSNASAAVAQPFAGGRSLSKGERDREGEMSAEEKQRQAHKSERKKRWEFYQAIMGHALSLLAG